jgi:hypothetical protein
MNYSIIISLVTLGAVILGALVNFSNLVGKRESKAAADARVEVKLDTIYIEVKDIRDSQKDNAKTLIEHGERIKAVEESAKSAHHRIDRLDNKEGREMIL